VCAIDRAADRHLIGELEIAAVRHAARDARNRNPNRLELALDQKRGRFAVDARRRREDQLLDALGAHALGELSER
jgi:hypothetical protein